MEIRKNLRRASIRILCFAICICMGGFVKADQVAVARSIIGVEYDEVLARCDSLFYFATNFYAISGNISVAHRMAFDAARSTTVIHVHETNLPGYKNLMRQLSRGTRDIFNANVLSIPVLVEYCQPLISAAYAANSDAVINGMPAAHVTLQLAKMIRAAIGI